MKRLVILAAALAGLGCAAPAFAHHSFAMFDMSKQVTLSGVIKDFQYTNPHSWLIVTVSQPDGKTVDWSFESEGPSSLLRLGVKKSSLPVGEKVTVKGMPMRDGRPGASLVSVTKSDGSVIVFRAGGPPPPGLNTAGAN